MILWSLWTFSTEKLNHNLYLGLQVSGLTYKSYSNSLMKSTLPRFPDSYIASKQRWPFLALPECPGGLITTFSTLPSPPSLSLSSESKKKLVDHHSIWYWVLIMIPFNLWQDAIIQVSSTTIKDAQPQPNLTCHIHHSGAAHSVCVRHADCLQSPERFKIGSARAIFLADTVFQSLT